MRTFSVLGFALVAFFQQAEVPRIEFVLIEPGAFMMGCADGDPQCDDDEKPAHRVHITRAFEIGKYEVTQAQWLAVMGSNPSRFRNNPNRPVERVSWNDAQAFVAELNEINDGYRYRLPSEAEWEYAARAGSTGVYAAPALDELGWYDSNASRETHDVGQKAPNAWGLYDVHGNVFEHVQDWYSSSTYQRGEVSDPTGPAEGEPMSPGGGRTITVRLAKGGSFYHAQWSQRISNKGVGPVNDRSETSGLRLLRTKIQ